MAWDSSALPCPLVSELSCPVPCPPLCFGGCQGWGHNTVTRKDPAAQLDSPTTPTLLTWMAVAHFTAWPCSHTSLLSPSVQACLQSPLHPYLLLWLQKSCCVPACKILPHWESSQQPAALEDILKILLASRVALMSPHRKSMSPPSLFRTTLASSREAELSSSYCGAQRLAQGTGNTEIPRQNDRSYFIQRHQLLTC